MAQIPTNWDRLVVEEQMLQANLQRDIDTLMGGPPSYGVTAAQDYAAQDYAAYDHRADAINRSLANHPDPYRDLREENLQLRRRLMEVEIASTREAGRVLGQRREQAVLDQIMNDPKTEPTTVRVPRTRVIDLSCDKK